MMNGTDIKRALGRPSDTSAVLVVCPECEQDIVMGFEGDYLCFWCRYKAETGLEAIKPDAVFSATPRWREEDKTEYSYVPMDYRKKKDWTPRDYGHDYDWSDFDL